MCSYCLQLECPPGCPNYEDKARNICKYCGEPICFGESYVENDEEEIVHTDCPSARWMAKFLGYDIHVGGMER